MAIADQIAVMDHSRIEQIGAPRELYDKPRTPFVMGFLGPVTQLGDALVRPHDVALSREAQPGAREAQVARVVHLGFQVRAELTLSDGSAVSAQLTRQKADELRLEDGNVVWLHTAGSTVLQP